MNKSVLKMEQQLEASKKDNPGGGVETKPSTRQSWRVSLLLSHCLRGGSPRDPEDRETTGFADWRHFEELLNRGSELAL